MLGNQRTNVGQGEYAVSDRSGEVLTAVLGSCVACCAFDPGAKVGGMNHILLPGSSNDPFSEERRYGVHLMELMLNDLYRHGASRQRLRFKLFGGSRMFDGLSDLGRSNIAFAKTFLSEEGYEVTSEDLGGSQSRRVVFEPISGRVMMKHGGAVPTVAAPRAIPKPPKLPVEAGEVDLF